VQAPAVAWAILVPGLIVHTTFGVLSGLVSAPLIRAVVTRTREREIAETEAAAAENAEPLETHSP